MATDFQGDLRSRTVVRTYTAMGPSLSPLTSLRMAFGELYWSRHVVWHLFRRDFVVGFRQKLLGYLWIVLVPLIGIASFVFMQSTGILNPGDIGYPYPVFVFIGTTLWAIFMTAMGNVANGLIGNTDLVMRTNIPKIGLAVTGLAPLSYSVLVGFVVLAIVMMTVRMLPSAWAVLYPFAILPIILLGVGMGLILSVVGAVARDVTGMATTVINLVMYVTPVIYETKFEHPVLQFIVLWNPLTYLVDTPRSLFVLGRVPNPLGFTLSTIFALVVFCVGIHAFYIIKDKVSERL
ncbi:ABC transporter permease [Tardiphaga sp. 804_B3_N1_9]|uniref:ABC transporter permease n=1 Tax=Tardiphaga TaxID=1395974 RepID=UPI0015867E47|nr:ABC transporter permease [Tardiphaga robiniae]NUU41324.1 ABC transporter permease [Tardiphaga robiniae]